MNRDLRLAAHWRVSRVRRCLRRKDKDGLVQFLRERHDERFFLPIRHLKTAPGNVQGYGFAMMALCALLVETIQSYRDGLPTTNPRELDGLRHQSRVPASYRIPSSVRVKGKKAFQRFFEHYRHFFPHVSGAVFYRDIRNGLLHQGQTKAGWTLQKRGFTVCDPQGKIIFRDDFAEKLEAAFDDYLKMLREQAWTSRVWTNATRKIWWLVRVSL